MAAVKKAAIKAIKPLVGCGASGDSLVAGKTYKVPADVSARDAGILIRMGKAEEVEVKPKAKAAEGPVHPEAFAEAIGKLEEGNTGHWTESGAPEVKALEGLGIKVSAKERDALWTEYRANRA